MWWIFVIVIPLALLVVTSMLITQARTIWFLRDIIKIQEQHLMEKSEHIGRLSELMLLGESEIRELERELRERPERLVPISYWISKN